MNLLNRIVNVFFAIIAAIAISVICVTATGTFFIMLLGVGETVTPSGFEYLGYVAALIFALIVVEATARYQ